MSGNKTADVSTSSLAEGTTGIRRGRVTESRTARVGACRRGRVVKLNVTHKTA